MRMDSGVESTQLPTGAFVKRTESLVAQVGPMRWSPTTMAEMTLGSEDELFSSEEPDEGVEPAGVQSRVSSEGMEAMDESKGKLTSITG